MVPPLFFAFSLYLLDAIRFSLFPFLHAVSLNPTHLLLLPFPFVFLARYTLNASPYSLCIPSTYNLKPSTYPS